MKKQHEDDSHFLTPLKNRPHLQPKKELLHRIKNAMHHEKTPPKTKRVTYFLPIVALALLFLLFAPILLDQQDHNATESNSEELLLKEADLVFTLLKEKEYKSLAGYIHPTRGLTFSLFANFGDSKSPNDIHFSKEAFESLTGEESYVWGVDLSERQYRMGIDEYIDEVLFTSIRGHTLKYEKITVNEVNNTGGVINTIPTYFPDAHFVSYYSEGVGKFKEYDWQYLRFVFEKVNNEWKLFGIARDVHSP